MPHGDIGCVALLCGQILRTDVSEVSPDIVPLGRRQGRLSSPDRGNSFSFPDHSAKTR